MKVILLMLFVIITTSVITSSCREYRDKVLYNTEYVVLEKGQTWRNFGRELGSLYLYSSGSATKAAWYEADTSIYNQYKVGDTIRVQVLQIVKNLKKIKDGKSND